MSITRRAGESDLDFALRQVEAHRATSDTRYNEIKRLRRALGSAETQLHKAESTLETLGQLHKSELVVPTWVSTTRGKKGKHVARPVLLLSDLHFDEVVDLDVMDGFNAYNRSIADDRLDRVVNGAVRYLRTYVSGVEYDGITLMLGGDIVTGTIHEELAETNEYPLPETVAYWTTRLASAIEYLADEFGRVHVPCVDGNHDRSGRRPKYKRRAMDSWAWTMYSMLAYIFRGDDRVDITVSESSELLVPVYDTRLLLVHGDGAKGGGGIGGIWPPISRYVHKKQSQYQSQGRPFDVAVMGHWHQLVQGSNFYVNGSLKGYDEYARGNAFPFERPQQLLLLVTPERGITLSTGIHAE